MEVAYKKAIKTGNYDSVQHYHHTVQKKTALVLSIYGSPYHYAIYYRCLNALHFLFKLGDKSYNDENNDEDTPLNYAIRYNYMDGLKFLLMLPGIEKSILPFIKYGNNSTAFYSGTGIIGIDILILLLERLVVVNMMPPYSWCGIRYQPEFDRVLRIIFNIPGAEQIEEGEAASIRYRIYFSRSLVSKLFLCLQN
jgi:hypothetical protein